MQRAEGKIVNFDTVLSPPCHRLILLIHRKVTTQEILSEVLKLDIAQNNQQKQRRVIGILQRLGCESKTISRNGKKLRAWVYMPTLEEGNIIQPDVTLSVTADVTAQIESQQAIQPAVTPVTSNNENFSENDENPSTDNLRNLIQTGVTRVTPSVNNAQNPCSDNVLSGNATVTDEESEWMSEENLQAMAEDLESCENIEMFQLMKSVYNNHALQVAIQGVSINKQQILQQWMQSIEC